MAKNEELKNGGIFPLGEKNESICEVFYRTELFIHVDK